MAIELQRPLCPFFCCGCQKWKRGNGHEIRYNARIILQELSVLVWFKGIHRSFLFLCVCLRTSFVDIDGKTHIPKLRRHGRLLVEEN